MVPTLSQPLNSQAWNYIYSRGTGNTCDMTIQQTVAINSPLLVSGNLCLQNSSSVLKGPLVVGGSVTMTNGNTIGTAANKISLAAIGNGCSKSNPAAASQNPCTGGAAVHVYADVVSSSPPAIPPPVRRLERLVRQRESGAVLPVHDDDRNTARCSRAEIRACCPTSI